MKEAVNHLGAVEEPPRARRVDAAELEETDKLMRGVVGQGALQHGVDVVKVDAAGDRGKRGDISWGWRDQYTLFS